MKATKTNAMRLLDQAHIPYTTATFAYSDKDFDGIHVAAAINLPNYQVYKTLIVQGEKQGAAVFCIPVDHTLDLKQGASLLKEKKISLYPVNDLLALTGYVRGGCSPIGMKKQFPTFFYNDCLNQPLIAVSAGQRGLQVLLSPKDLLTITKGQLML